MQINDTYHLIEALISEEKFEEAEERLVEVAMRPELLREYAGSFTNSLAYSILIPQGRFREAHAWLDDVIQWDCGYESWNSISNLGHVMIKLGNLEEAEKLFQLVIDANAGPIDEAEEFLDMLNSGAAENLIESAEDPKESKTYMHVYEYLKEHGLAEAVVNLFASSRGPAVQGFVKGVMSADGISALSPTDDQVAQALSDFIIDDILDPLPSYQDAVFAVKQGDTSAEHRRVLREVAIQGSGEAAFLLAQAILLNQGGENHQAWLNVAKARGFQSQGARQSKRSPTMF
jgi:tetratricopeptide (TPR) repeat protein